jgi:hypothetical protein
VHPPHLGHEILGQRFTSQPVDLDINFLSLSPRKRGALKGEVKRASLVMLGTQLPKPMEIGKSISVKVGILAIPERQCAFADQRMKTLLGPVKVRGYLALSDGYG